MGLGQGGGLLNRWVKEVTVKTPPVELTLLSGDVSNCLSDTVDLEANSDTFRPENIKETLKREDTEVYTCIHICIYNCVCFELHFGFTFKICFEC